MILFISFGSWGEVAPLLEIALQMRDIGIETMFATTPEWAERVDEYGIRCHRIGKTVSHEDTMDAFMRTRLCGHIQSLYDEIDEAAKDANAIVSSFYIWPAAIVAEKRGKYYRATTTSAMYFMDTEPVESIVECREELNALRASLGLPATDPMMTTPIGLYPWFLDDDVAIDTAGFPQLRNLKLLSNAVADFIESPHAVISCGTIVDVPRLNEMVAACHEIGLKVLYLGKYHCDADLCAYFEPHALATAKATVAITHAGIGTTIDCMHAPMVLAPAGYDQYYNAKKLVSMDAAVMIGDDIVESLRAALAQKRVTLGGHFSLNTFSRLL